MEDAVTYDMREAHMYNLLETIKDISDLEWQQKVWIENSIPGIFSTWEETMCMFFDDANIDDFLGDLDPKFGFSEQQVAKLWEFRNKLRVYSHNIYAESEKKNEYYVNPEQIISDPRWHEIAECAKTVLKAFEGYKVPHDDEKL